jgi:hypothetical protein
VKILSFIEFLNEALRDEINPHLINAISNDYHYDDYLNHDIPKSNNLIPNIDIKISDEHKQVTTILKENFKSSLISNFIKTELYNIIASDTLFKLFITKSLNEDINPYRKNFIDTLKNIYSDNYLCLVPEGNVLLKVFNSTIAGPILWESNIDEGEDNKISVGQVIAHIYDVEIKSVKEGYIKILVPSGTLVDSNTAILKIIQDQEDPVFFSNRKVNLFKFIESYKKIYQLDYDINSDSIYNGLKNEVINFDQTLNDIDNAELSLVITDKPEDKLNMSISRFYDSCQNVYTGDYRLRLLSNVFDPNMKIAYLRLNIPYTNKITYPYTNCSRCIIRYTAGKILFDKVYPDYIESLMYSIIEKYTFMKNNDTYTSGKSREIYDFKPIKGLPLPYMDKYKLNVKTTVDEQRFNAISYFTKAKPKDIQEIPEGITDFTGNFIIGDKKYLVLHEDEAYNIVIEYFKNNFIDLFGDMTIEDFKNNNILDNNLVPVWKSYFNVKSVLDLIKKLNLTQDKITLKLWYSTQKNSNNLHKKLLDITIIEKSINYFKSENDLMDKDLRENIFGKEYTLTAYDEFFIYKK